jgi:hypothetical protein
LKEYCSAWQHGSEFSHPFHIFCEVKVSLDEFIRVNEKVHEVQGPLQTTIQFFLEEATHMYAKINCDVVMDKELGKIWIDIIAWDYEGIVMAADRCQILYI